MAKNVENKHVKKDSEATLSGFVIPSPSYVDIIDVSKLECGTRIILRFKIDEETSSQILPIRDKYGPKDLIYSANLSLIYNSKDYHIDCYVNLPHIHLNTTGTVLSCEGYLAILTKKDCFDRKLTSEIFYIKLVDKVEQLPNWN